MSTQNTSYSYSYSNETFSGCDMVATILMPDSVTGQKLPYAIGELQTISYSIHMDRQPVRSIGNINVKDYVMGPRTIAGSLVFAVFNKHFAKKIMCDINNKISPGYSFMIDELPPFDVVITAANEYGLRSRLVIYGIRLVNEGQVMSINDIYTENTYQFVATDLEYLTDENTYQSSIVNNKYMYKISDGNNIMTITRPKENYIPSNIETRFSIDLNYRVRSNASKNGLGIVDLWLTPTRKTGTIKIFNDVYSATINVENSISKSNIVSVHLPAGLYTAYWSDEAARESATVKFVVVEDIEVIQDEMPAPLIEFVSDNRIIVRTNYKKHSHIGYINENNETFTTSLTGGKATIKNLASENTYIFFSCNADMSTKSDEVKIKTLAVGYDMFYDLLDYLKYNKKALRYDDFDKYVQAVTEARDLTFSGVFYENVSSAFVDAKNNNTVKLNSLIDTDFPGLIEYQEEVDRLTILINICEELAILSSSLQTDKVYGYNYKTMVVQPPKIIKADDGMATLLVDETIDSIDFYRQFTKTTQFSSNINKRNFKETEDGYICKFNGRPNTKHFAYAINSFGFKSPRVDFFSLENNAQIIANKKAEDQAQEIAYQLEKAKYNYGSSIDVPLSEQDTVRVLVEAIKDNNVYPTVVTPQVLRTSDESITLTIDEDNEILAENNLKVAISNPENSLISVSRYKVAAASTVEFTLEEHGLRPNENYVMWIENENEDQVSKCVTASTENIEELNSSNEQAINKISVNNIITTIKKQLKEYELSSNLIETIINVQQDNAENNKTNIVINIIKSIMLEYQNVANAYDVIYLLFCNYINNMYFVNEDFFEDAPVLNKTENTLRVCDDCIAYQIDFDVNDMSHNISKITSNSLINLNSQSLYSAIYFADMSLSKRSGFILINNLSKEYRTYNMTVKVGA